MKTGFRDRKHGMIIIIEHNETVIKSKYENNGYWLCKYYLEYLKGHLMIERLLVKFIVVAGYSSDPWPVLRRIW